MTNEPNTQLRAICPCCFREQATRNGAMVQHGYERPEGWQQNVGNCGGVDFQHFGTPEGRQATLEFARQVAGRAAQRRKAAADTRSGIAPVWARKHGARHLEMIVDPTQKQRDDAVRRLEQQAQSDDQGVEYLKAKAAAWKAANPRKVLVEKKIPLVHASRNNGSKLCGYLNAYKGQMTSNAAEVTCPKCIANQARLAAKVAK